MYVCPDASQQTLSDLEMVTRPASSSHSSSSSSSSSASSATPFLTPPPPPPTTRISLVMFIYTPVIVISIALVGAIIVIITRRGSRPDQIVAGKEPSKPTVNLRHATKKKPANKQHASDRADGGKGDTHDSFWDIPVRVSSHLKGRQGNLDVPASGRRSCSSLESMASFLHESFEPDTAAEARAENDPALDFSMDWPTTVVDLPGEPMMKLRYNIVTISPSSQHENPFNSSSSTTTNDNNSSSSIDDDQAGVNNCINPSS